MSIDILNRWTRAVVYHSETAKTIAEAVVEAVGNHASLVDANLDGASLDGASLIGANLVGASLDGASLDGASLVDANLDGASLDGASLIDANLDGASLDGASLDGAYRLSLSGSAHPIRAAQNSLVSIGCEIHPITEWLDTFRAIGAKHKYTEAQIEEYGRLLSIVKAWIDIPQVQP